MAEENVSFWNQALGQASLDDKLAGGGARWYKQNTSYSGCDIKVLVQTTSQGTNTVDPNAGQYYNPLYGGVEGIRDDFKVLAELQTLSYSTFRKKIPVQALGESNPKSYVRGQRTIAGSMIFSVFNQHVLASLCDNNDKQGVPTHESFDAERSYQSLLLDQLPPFDIVVTFANEYGNVSRLAIYGCEIISEGQVHSVQDLLVENTCSYVARFIEPMRNIFSMAQANSVLMNELMKAYSSYPGTPTRDDLASLARLNVEWHGQLRQQDMGRVSTLYNLLRNDETRNLLAQSRNPFR